ncbi:hypothetical protein [Silvimonas iriomotensis]|nr:hypothetical protein [Silvimonas iriomotensis]
MANLQYVGFTTSLTAIAAACMLAGCGGSDSGTSTSAPNSQSRISGVVSSTAYTPGSAGNPTLTAGYIKGATVCIDSNNDGICESGENPVTTDANGKFTLNTATPGPIIADISTSAINTATGTAVTAHEILRASLAQVTEQAAGLVVVSPMSSEVQRMVEDNGTDYQTEKGNLAARVGVTSAQVLGDLAALTGTAQSLAVAEANALNNRYVYATKKFDNKELYPDALAVPGGDPELASLAVSSATNTVKTDPRQPITFLQAQQAAFNVEGIPRYDSVFIVMLENKGTTTILGSAYAPKINGYLQANNQFTSYYATSNPSEPNYTALGGADDWGITDDSQWNCDATGANAVQDLPVPDNTQPGLANSPFSTTCTQAAGINHNITGRANLFNALTSKGLRWRTYSESMNPGQDFRTDSIADSAVTATDHVYPPGTLGNNTTAIGNANLTLPMPAGLYKTKHHPGMAYQNVRSAPEWKFSNRTLGGGQWDAALASGSKYTVPAGYNVDQFSTDLQSGDVGQINFLMPDQCDDMHSISVTGTVSGGGTGTASDCASGNNIITRGDNYVDYLVKKIQASPLWANRQKRVAIVLMFDEGTATTGHNACCGWVPGSSGAAASTNTNPLVKGTNGQFAQDTSIHNYNFGNHGHGESIFAVITNQTGAPKQVSDSDAYSHFSFVRTLQDMFQLADPADDSSYMNRSKYTEKFIAQNILNLPEYQSSADTHFDAVRPMNHAYVIPKTYTQIQSADTQSLTPQVGPDATQKGVWAVK